MCFEARTLPRQVATRDCATVEKVPKMAMAKSTICFTIVCAASATGPSAAPHNSHLSSLLLVLQCHTYLLESAGTQE